MREQRRPLDDPEILELLQDEPELLAIADALAATRAHRSRHRPPFRLLAAAAFLGLATIGASISYVLLADSESPLSERALAAIGDGHVIHVISERDESARLLIDLRTNQTRQAVTNTEIWFDSSDGTVRTRARRNGTLIADGLERGAAPRDPRAQQLGSFVVAAFAKNYRRALESGSASAVGSGVIDGVAIGWIEFVAGGQTMEVAVSEQTALPLAFRFSDGTAHDVWRISSIESKQRAAADFAAEQAARHATSGRVVSETLLQLVQAPSLNGRHLWAGRTVDGLTLRTATLQTLTRASSGQSERTRGLKLVYRGDRDAFVEVLQALTPEPAYGYADDRLTLGLVPIPEETELALMPTDPRGRVWVGQFRTRGIYVTIRGSDRDVVIRAARLLARPS